MKFFTAKIFKLGINPYVDVPETILNYLFKQAGKTKGPIPVRGKLNGKEYKQTVVKYQGAWRLYLNTQMRKDVKLVVGDIAKVQIEFDPKPRVVPKNPMLTKALVKNKKAKLVFEKLSPSRQKEILNYLNSLKTEESVLRNIEKIIKQLIRSKHS